MRKMKLVREIRGKLTGAIIVGTFAFWHVAWSSETVQIERTPAGLALTYTRALDANVDVEVSDDLRHWELTDRQDTVVAADDVTETIRSDVNGEGASQLFFRLAIAPRRDVTLQWDPVPESDVAGYRVHLKRNGENRERLIDVGNSTVTTLPLSANGRVYFFCVTTYDESGGESEPSAAVAIRLGP